MAITPLATFTLGDTTVIYLMDQLSRQVGLWIVPTQDLNHVRRVPSVDDTAVPYDVAKEHGRFKWTLDPLVHVQRVGDAYPAFFSQGRTLRNGPSTLAFTFVDQAAKRGSAEVEIVTRLAAADGVILEHHLSWRHTEQALRVFTRLINNSPSMITLELLTSFSLGGITPFTDDDAHGRLLVHRCRSTWAAEGRMESRTVEEIHLEPSFSRYSANATRFGQVGTMPVRDYFPFVAVEDIVASVLWGAQIAWPGSWQIELYRQDDQLAISGGLADREFGHWLKNIAPGETFTAPTAIVATVHGTLDDLCARLTQAQEAAADQQPKVEKELPLIFNEWCTTWGNPTHDRIIKIARRLAGTTVKYLVIDAGWYKGEIGNGHGDWLVRDSSFPDGLLATAREVRKLGLIPGLWFEFENCSEGSSLYLKTAWHLHRDGKPLTFYQRHFLDFTNPDVIAYLTQRVIGLLRDNDIGYLKVDYNETIGIGCDGCESLGEGLRRQVQASIDFFAQIRRELPELVIENCASGGHRLEPAMLGLSAMSSFSDAHEAREIPIIAANLQRMMLPRQSQIWAVLREADDERRLVYSLAAGFLGRLCLSGDIERLSPAAWAVFQNAEQLYRQVWPIIKHGRSTFHGPRPVSYRHPTGSQAVVRRSTAHQRDEAAELLIVVHHFAGAGAPAEIPLPAGQWTIRSAFARQEIQPKLVGATLACALGEWDAAVVWLTQK